MSKNNAVEPYSIGKCLVIITVLALFDTVGCIVLLVGSYVFMKKGHQGLAIALAVTNIIIPDALPCVDEIFQIIVVVVPIYRGYKNDDSVGQIAKDVVKSQREYSSQRNKAVNVSQKVSNVIGGQDNNYGSYDEDYDEEYIDMYDDNSM